MFAVARRRIQEEHVNHEAWAIPYGDLITLLLAFFVVMYALSSVNEGKYRVLSDSLVAAFRGAPKSLEPIQIGQISKSFHELHLSEQRTLVPLEIEAFVQDDDVSLRDREVGWSVRGDAFDTPASQAWAERMIETLFQAIVSELDELIEEDLVTVRQNRHWLEVEINTSLLFETASAQLADQAEAIVARLAGILAQADIRLQIEGHTDSLPINTEIFPSNWELSTARAANVVRLFGNNGVNPARMAAVGFGEFRPAADNSTQVGRTKNRRVIIVVMAKREDQAIDNRIAEFSAAGT
ncbi:MAG: flagellar motor protein MotD [Gammaproteobacteria bacterium]|nr:MAG: flagellar motor protein MotD [Gammaproteobacteria bacterium]